MDGRSTERTRARRTFRLLLCGVVACAPATLLPAQSSPRRIAFVLDQEAPSFGPQAAVLEREIQGFFRPGQITLLPPQAGDGTAAGVPSPAWGGSRVIWPGRKKP